MVKFSVAMVLLSTCTALVVGAFIEQLPDQSDGYNEDADVAGGCCEEYASKVIGVSSEYYSADQVLYAPNYYPQTSWSDLSWAPSSCGGQQEYLELEFPSVMKIYKITVYENYCYGSVSKLSVYNPKKKEYQTVYEGQETDVYGARAFEPEIEAVRFKSNRIRLEMICDCWNQIDAVKITGSKCKRAKSEDNSSPRVVSCSSESSTTSYSDVQVEGPPNTTSRE